MASDNSEIIAAKQDIERLKMVLGIADQAIKKDGAACPLCGHKGCFSYGPAKNRPDQYEFRCFSCSKNGSIVNAVMLIKGVTVAEAMRELKDQYRGTQPKQSAYTQYHALREQNIRNGHGPHGPSSPIQVQTGGIQYGAVQIDPIIDLNLAEPFIEKHHKFLLENLDFSEKYERGLSKEVIEKYRIGFMQGEFIKFTPWSKQGMLVPSAWTIPITDANGKLKCVKIHCEERARVFDKDTNGYRDFAKVFPAPFGTKPEWKQETNIRPRHAYYGIWPHPLTQDAPPMLLQGQDTFSMSMGWWIDRIPPDFQEEWQTEYNTQKIMVCYDMGVADPAELDAEQCTMAMEKAFQNKKRVLEKAICAAENRKAQLAGGTNGSRHDHEPSGLSDDERDWSQYIIIAPGELKALAAISAGFVATAPTGGETWFPRPEMFSAFAGRCCCIAYDDDPIRAHPSKDVANCTGLDWAMKWTAALLKHGATDVVAKCGGKKEDV